MSETSSPITGCFLPAKIAKYVFEIMTNVCYRSLWNSSYFHWFFAIKISTVMTMKGLLMVNYKSFFDFFTAGGYFSPLSRKLLLGIEAQYLKRECLQNRKLITCK